MKLTQQAKLFEEFVKKQSDTMLKKGDDYAGEDRLFNFKTAAAIVKQTPQQQCLSLIATKVARLGTLFDGRTLPNNESINDSIEDLANYSFLLYCILNEQPETQSTNANTKSN